jgi:ATP-dependent exoDNAse (exonuclease V) alpha subunit
MNIPSSLDMNPAFKKALESMEHTNKNLFITGKAGTGKSTLLQHFRSTTKKQIAVLAPTGVAAVNIQGQTIHSFFKFKPDITLDKVKTLYKESNHKNIYKKLDSLVIDEISMVRADLLDCVDRFLQLNRFKKGIPFGGVQMIFIGDLYQLPPVVPYREKEIFAQQYPTPYFFSARVYDDLDMGMLELKKIYRQQDDRFIALLNAIRNNTIDDAGISILNERYDHFFQPPEGNFFIQLTTTNALAEELNHLELEKIQSKTLKSIATVDGKFGKEYCPAPLELHLKKGAQVMLLNNDLQKRWVNGTVGKVLDFITSGDEVVAIRVELQNGKQVLVAPYTWEVFQFYVEENMIQSAVLGTFSQYPLMLAWAVTIHKSQGKTFENVVINVGFGTFAHGQMYVALSRCTTLEGIVLKKPMKKMHILMDKRVVEFHERYKKSSN